MKYVNSKGHDLCITKSLASAFFALGWHDQSSKIDSFGVVILVGTGLGPSGDLHKDTLSSMGYHFNVLTKI